MEHSFNVKIAESIGVAPAIILNNFFWWIEKNRANNKHFHDGHYWTYNSKKAFSIQFPYFTERQIDYAIRKLKDEGYIVTGNYNKSSYDRTLWYTITEKGFAILQNCKMENSNLQDAGTENVKPIPDIKTDSKPVKEERKEEKKKRQSYEEILLSLVDDPNVRDCLIKYIQMRIAKKNYPTNSALELLIKRLQDLSKDPQEQIKIVEQAIRGNYMDFKPLRKEKKGSPKNPKAVYEKFDPAKDKLATDAEGKPLVY